MFKWIFLYFNLCPLPVVFWLSTTEKSPAPSYSFPPIRYYIHWQDPPELSLLQADQSWFSQPSCVWESFPGLVAPSPSNRGKVDLPVVFAPPPPSPDICSLPVLGNLPRSPLPFRDSQELPHNDICQFPQHLWVLSGPVDLHVSGLFKGFLSRFSFKPSLLQTFHWSQEPGIPERQC